MALSTERFPNRVAGSAFEPFVVEVRDSDGKLRDLTGQTATMTLRKVKGVTAVMTDQAHSNTPGTAGVFSFQATAAQVASHGEYVATITEDLGGTEPEVVRFFQTITPSR